MVAITDMRTRITGLPGFIFVCATVVLVAASTGGCATTGTGKPGAGANAAPALSRCAEGIGATRENPVRAKELSRLAAKELLVCPGGAIARVISGENVISASAGVASSVGVMTIRCPDAQYQFMTDVDDEAPMQAACVPPPLTVLAADAAALVGQSTTKLKDGEFGAALRLAARAERIAPESEAVLIALGSAQMVMQKFKDAEKTLAGALEINPGSVTIRLAHAVCLSEIGQKAGYAAEIFRLYDEVPKSDPLHWELTCRVADNFNRIGNRQEAIRLARVACEHGVDMCCDLARSDIDAREIE